MATYEVTTEDGSVYEVETDEQQIEQSSNTFPTSEIAKKALGTAVNQGPIQSAIPLNDPKNLEAINNVLGTPMRGLRGLGVAAAQGQLQPFVSAFRQGELTQKDQEQLAPGIERINEATQPEFQPLGVKEKLADLAASIADPRNAAFNQAAGAIVGKIGEKVVAPIANASGRTAARLVNIVSGVPAEDVKAVANQPLKALFSKTRNTAGKAYGEAKQLAGVTKGEERIIAGIGDPSGYKRVADTFNKLADKEGIDKLSTGKLLAWQKAANELSRKAKGSAEAIYAQDAAKVQAELEKRALQSPEVENLLKTKSDASFAIARSKFASLFPRNKTKGDAVLRGLIQGGTAVGVNPLAAAAFAPATYYLPTVGAGLASKGTEAGFNIATQNPAIRQTLLALLEQLKSKQGEK